ncbi:transcriptional regulator [Cnuibacter physcomitrellae]|nr:LCP family protein [Cnuibacter physcomitrellae]GGI42338.1 transcriptional regulator [Cnuibacter physcomitrellae]
MAVTGRGPTPIRHRRASRRTPWLVLVRWMAIGAAVIVAATVGVVGVAVASLSQQLSDNAVDLGTTPTVAPPLLGPYPGGFNLLVVGTDNDPNQADSYGARSATLNDVTILVHVASDHQSATIVSLPRDLVIAQPACVDPATGTTASAVSARPLNEAWGRGGLACVAATVSDLTGMSIPYAAATSFAGVVNITDAIGGVDVCLTGPITDPYSGLDLPAGHSIIQGDTALAFLRSRHGIGDGSDLSRIGSQQQYLASLVRTVKSQSTLTDVTKVFGLAQAAAQNIRPSTSLQSVDAITSLALTLKDVDTSRIAFVSYPVTTYVNDSNKVQPAQATADQLFLAIKNDQSISLSGGTTATGSTAIPPAAGAPTPPSTNTPAADAPPATAVQGITGQTADEQTCADPFFG